MDFYPTSLSARKFATEPANDMSSLYEALAHLDARLGNYQEARAFETRRTGLWRQWDRKLPGNPYIRRQMEKPLLNLPSDSAK